ncbi:MAG: TPM domain-containing protein [Lachnospiraceae bacterium]|nr:TPM domain-containing protein [Lachnospiraceae bacterium]
MIKRQNKYTNKATWLSCFLAIVFCLTILFSSTTVKADEELNLDMYRALDMAGDLSDVKKEDLDGYCLEFANAYQVDLVMINLTPDAHSESTLQEVGDYYYEENNFGYGADHSGFLMICDISQNMYQIIPYGKAGDLIPDDYLRYTESCLPGYVEEYGSYGVMYATYKFLYDYPQTHEPKKKDGVVSTPAKEEGSQEGSSDAQTRAIESEISEEIDAEAEDAAGTDNHGTDESAADTATDGSQADATRAVTSTGTGHIGNGIPKTSSISEFAGDDGWLVEEDTSERENEGNEDGLPDWYPTGDPTMFTFYHDAEAARVVDRADLFTDEQEKAMEEQIKELRKELSRDIVIYTDTTSYGFGREIVAADFYDFNGYGWGDEYEGICMFICMDPNNRGWFSSCFGPDTKAKYTEDAANEIDDALYEYMAAGNYYDGVSDWVYNIGNMYRLGYPFAPSWYVSHEQAAQGITGPYANGGAPRVMDDAYLLDDATKGKLSERASKLVEIKDCNVIIHTAKSYLGMEEQEYAEMFFKQNGYDKENGGNAILLLIKAPGGRQPDMHNYGFGTGKEILGDLPNERLRSLCIDDLQDGYTKRSVEDWLDGLRNLMEKGRVPRGFVYWCFVFCGSLIVGLIFGVNRLLKARKKMKKPTIIENADQYVVPGTLSIRKVKDSFIRKSVNKVYSPVQTESSSSRSSGGSSYRSSYSGSSGRSHSGSGRSF